MVIDKCTSLDEKIKKTSGYVCECKYCWQHNVAASVSDFDWTCNSHVPNWNTVIDKLKCRIQQEITNTTTA